MNLHGIVRRAIQTVTPDTLATWQRSIGYTIETDGKQLPAYATMLNVPVQVQGLSSRDLAHIDNLNLEGVLRKAYIFDSLDGVVRVAVKGGDLLQFPDFTPIPVFDQNGVPVRDQNNAIVMGFAVRVWKVVAVLERWPDVQMNGWTSAVIALQTDPPYVAIVDQNGNPILDPNSGKPVLS